MAHPEELQALNKAFTGLGVDEKSLVTILGKSHPEHRRSFRRASPHMFIEDERSFERWDDSRIKLLKQEFMRFKNALVLWAMHPWERDARFIKEALREGPQAYSVIVEVACTRSSEELLGARKAYHSLFDHSVEEDVATHVHGTERQLLVALVSAYRYEGPKVKDDAAKSEAKLLAAAIKNGGKKGVTENGGTGKNGLIEDVEVIRILSTRSKPHLKEVYKHYHEISGKSILEDLGSSDYLLKATVECLCSPHVYFSKVLFDAKQKEADKGTKKALTRVIVTRADVDMKEIQEEYNKSHGVSLAQKIDETANGNYKDFLLTLITKEN